METNPSLEGKELSPKAQFTRGKAVHTEGQPKQGTDFVCIRKRERLIEEEGNSPFKDRTVSVREGKPPDKERVTWKPERSGLALLLGKDIGTLPGPGGQADPARDKEEVPIDNTKGGMEKTKVGVLRLKSQI